MKWIKNVVISPSGGNDGSCKTTNAISGKLYMLFVRPGSHLVREV